MITAEDVKINLADTSIYYIYDRAVEHFLDGSIFVELGCFQGGSTIYLAQAIQRAKKDIKIYAVDIWENMTAPNRDLSKPTVAGSIFHEFWKNVWDAECEQIIRPIHHDSRLTAFAFEDQSVDFVFVDANHRYDYVKADILNWLPKIKNHGWMGGHDYNQEVERAVREIFIEDKKMKVEKCTGDGKVSKNCNSFLVRL